MAKQPQLARPTGGWVSLAVAAALSACYGGLDGHDGKLDGADGDAADGGEGGDDGDRPENQACSDDAAAPTQLHRLTRAQFNATVRDLLEDPSEPADAFVGDGDHLGFDRNIEAVSRLQVDQYRQVAKTLAETAAADRFDAWITCDRGDDGCVESFVRWFGRRAYRRPLSDEEVMTLVGGIADARARWDANEALTLAVQSMLMSPHFLYHIELGRPGAEQQLTGFELASRLSYSLWGTMPDDDLLDAAEDGALDTRAGIEQHARRMLADPRARDMVTEFGRQWLDLRDFDALNRDTELFPEWSVPLKVAMREETETFLREVVLEGDGRLETLLTAPYSYLTPELAAHYGVDPPAEPFAKTALPTAERAGFLTHASFLANHAYPSETSWVARGKFVRERLLCGELPPPPEGVDQSQTNNPDRTSSPECAGCHIMMDPIGQGFDAYGPTGRFDPSLDVEGEVRGSDIGAFGSVVELSQALAQSEEVRTCFSEQVTAWTVGAFLPRDNCAREDIETTFTAADYDVRELLVAIATSDAFRFRRNE